MRRSIAVVLVLAVTAVAGCHKPSTPPNFQKEPVSAPK
jgi:hypothetical protein